MKKERIELNKKTVKELYKFMEKNEINEYDHQKNNLRIRLDFPQQDSPKKPIMPPIATKLLFACISILIMFILWPTLIDEIEVLQNWTAVFYISMFWVFYYIMEIIHNNWIRKDRWISINDTIQKQKSYADSKEPVRGIIE